MFFVNKKRRRCPENKSAYWIIVAFIMSIGMLCGFFSFKFGGEKYLYTVGIIENVFTYSFVKNCIFMTMLFLNSFSLVGFPLSAMLLFFVGYLQAISAFYIFANNTPFSFVFLLRIMPHSVLSLYISMFMGVHILSYSKKLYTAFVYGRNKAFLREDIIRLLFLYFYSLFISACIAFDETNFL